jgi:ubiquinone biosynthesis monooxygenase Coq6
MNWRVLTRSFATNAKPKLQDVVIIGGGPAGLSILGALKASHKTKHLKCTLIEAGSLEPVSKFYQDPPEEYTNRVVSLTPKSVEFMQHRIGNWEFIHQDRVKFYDQIVAYDGQDNSSRIEFDSTTVGNEYLAVMCENINIQSSLLQKINLINDSQTTILDKTKVVDITNPITPTILHDLHEYDTTAAQSKLDWPIIKLDNGDLIQTRLLIGADGYQSPARKYAGIESRGWQYNTWGVVGTIKLEYEDHSNATGWQRFLTTGPLAILPLTENNASIVWSSTPELSQILLKTNPKIFPHLINGAMCLSEIDLQYYYKQLDKNPDDMTIIDDLKWRMSKLTKQDQELKYPIHATEILDGSRARFPLKLSHADTYVAPRVALIGDAAHTIHPLAGQGLNMGQTDVASLMNALEKGIERGMDIGSTLVLEPYFSNAWPANNAMLGVCDKLHKVFSTNWYPLVLLRGIGMKSINFADPIKDLMVKAISNRDIS